jgi:hypothetical protein
MCERPTISVRSSTDPDGRPARQDGGMRTWWNVALQLAALAAFVLLRLSAFGWMAFIFVFTLIGPILVLVPTGLAIATVSRRRLTRAVTVSFVATACFLVLTGAVYPDFGDSPYAYLPVVATPIPSSSELVGIAFVIGNVAALGFIAGVIWIAVAVCSSARSRPIP